MESGYVFVVLGAHVMVLTLIKGCQFNTNFPYTSTVYFVVK